jgi:acyl-CoA thioesterase
MMASLDHAMWFHRRFRADEGLLHMQTTPAPAGGRGFATGSVYTQEAVLVVSVAQEGLIRRIEAWAEQSRRTDHGGGRLHVLENDHG